MKARLRAFAALIVLSCNAPPAPAPARVEPPLVVPPLASAKAAPPPAASASAAPTRRAGELPRPLDAAEQKELATTCKPIVDAYEYRMDHGPKIAALSYQVSATERTLADPPSGLAPACVGLFARKRRDEVVRAIEYDARRQLEALARGMAKAYARDGRLCRSGVVPDTLPPLWSSVHAVGEPWICLGVEGATRTSVQVDVRTHDDDATFVARASPFAIDPLLLEWTLEGRIEGGAFAYDPAQIALTAWK